MKAYELLFFEIMCGALFFWDMLEPNTKDIGPLVSTGKYLLWNYWRPVLRRKGERHRQSLMDADQAPASPWKRGRPASLRRPFVSGLPAESLQDATAAAAAADRGHNDRRPVRVSGSDRRPPLVPEQRPDAALHATPPGEGHRRRSTRLAGSNRHRYLSGASAAVEGFCHSF